MIKKLILLFLLLPSLVFADAALIGEESQTPASESSCPSFYSSAIFSWDGDHDSGTNYGCLENGSSLEGINTNLTISTSYGESSSNGSFHDERDENLSFSNSPGKIDLTGAQTLWLRVYIPDNADLTIGFFEAYYAVDNYIAMVILNTGVLTCTFSTTGGGTATASGTALSVATWVDIAYSWDRPNQDHSVNTNSSWQEDVGELTSDPTGTPATFKLGNLDTYLSAGARNNSIRVTQFALVPGYETAKPW